MRTAIRLGLVAASLAGSAALANPASAACYGAITPPPLPHAGAAVCDYPGSVKTFPLGSGYIVCWMGHAPVQVWVASNALGAPTATPMTGNLTL